MSHDVRGRVFRERPGHWVYEVEADGDVVFTDNTGAWATLYEACRRHVYVADVVVWSGHRLRPFADLVNEAPDL